MSEFSLVKAKYVSKYGQIEYSESDDYYDTKTYIAKTPCGQAFRFDKMKYAKEFLKNVYKNSRKLQIDINNKKDQAYQKYQKTYNKVVRP